MLEIEKTDTERRIEQIEEGFAGTEHHLLKLYEQNNELRRLIDALDKEIRFNDIYIIIVAIVAAAALILGCIGSVRVSAAEIPTAGASTEFSNIISRAESGEIAEEPEEVSPELRVEDDTAYIYENGEIVRSYDNYSLLAACVEAEAADEPFEGKRMVADVILNRVDTAGYPDSVYGVITQPYRFTSYWNGAIDWRLDIGIQQETCEAVAGELLERGYPGLYFFQEGSYSEYGTPWKKIGNHYFSTL